MRHKTFMLLFFTLLLSHSVSANRAIVEIRIKDHLFIPSEITIPKNTKVKLIVINEDETPEEFESYELNREKVIMGKAKTVIFVGPLKPGVYAFFGEFNPHTAQGIIKVEEQ